VLNRWIAKARKAGAWVVATRDWHPANHVSFHERGGAWPSHCVQGTRGAEFHPDLELPADIRIVDKATERDHECFSALSDSVPGNLPQELVDRGIRRLWVGGLALDYCVQAAVRDALRLGFEVHLIVPATRAVNPLVTLPLLAELQAAGAKLEE
jgi:nicotinamidase/pyrazinamidase